MLTAKAEGCAKESGEKEQLERLAREKAEEAREHAEAEKRLLEEAGRVVEFRVKAEDLSATTEDTRYFRQLGRSRGKEDWRFCFVGGGQSGAHGTVHRAVWKASKSVSVVDQASPLLLSQESLRSTPAAVRLPLRFARARRCNIPQGQGGTPVAIKVLKLSPVGPTSSLPRSLSSSSNSSSVASRQVLLNDEMKLFRDLTHSNVVTCYGILSEHVGPKGGSTVKNSIVTELCSTPLNMFIEDDKFWRCKPVEAGGATEWLTQWDIDAQKCKVMHDVIKGLDYLHDNNVLHRDIKTSNILLDGTKQNWKLCDFGEARKLRPGEQLMGSHI